MAAREQTLGWLEARQREQTPQALARLTVVGLFIGLWFALWTAQIPMPVPFLLVLVVEIVFFLLYWRIVFLLQNVRAIEISHYGMLAAEIVFHTTMVYFLGGISWLGSFAYVFGLIFSNTFLDLRRALFYTTGASFAFAALVLLEASGVIPHYSYLEEGPIRYSDARFVATTLLGGAGVFFSICIWTNWVGRQLRRERDTAVRSQGELLEARIDLQRTNEELEERVKERTSLLELTNAALLESERRVRTIVGNAPVVLFALDCDGVFTMADGKALDDLRIDSDSLVGRSAFELFEGQPAVHVAVRTALTGETATTIVGSEPAQFEARLTPLRGSDDEVVGVIGVATDVTERRRAEDALKVKARQQAAVATLGHRALTEAPLMSLMQDAVELLASNLGVDYCKVLELIPDSGSLLLRAGVGWRDGIVGSATVGIGKNSQAGYTLLSREPVVVADLNTDARFDGPPLLRDHGVVSGMSVVIPGEGGPFGVLGIHTTKQRSFTDDDVHFLQAVANVLAEAIERRRARKALQESEEILRATVESTADGILVVNDDGQVVYSNDRFARMWRIPRELIETREDEKLLAYVVDQLEDPQAFLANVHELYQTSREHSDVLQFKDGRAFERFSRPLLRDDAAVGRVWSFRDITERTRAEGALRESENRFRTMAETVAAATFIFQGARMRYVNSAAEEITGYNREDLLKMDFWEVIHPEYRELVKERGLARQNGEEMPGGYEVKIQTKDGRSRWVDFTAGTLDFEGQPAILGTAFDITERKQAEAALLQAANHDPLTGLLNRRAGIDAIEARLGKAKESSSQFAVLVLDLDRFKVINDSFSHETGDAALIQFSEVMLELVGNRGVICRMGGDEFQIGLDGTGPNEAFAFSRQVQHALRRKLERSDAQLRPQFTVSIGIACYPDDGDSILVLGRRADRAMYTAKLAGANTSRAWHQIDNQAA